MHVFTLTTNGKLKRGTCPNAVAQQFSGVYSLFPRWWPPLKLFCRILSFIRSENSNELALAPAVKRREARGYRPIDDQYVLVIDFYSGEHISTTGEVMAEQKVLSKFPEVNSPTSFSPPETRTVHLILLKDGQSVNAGDSVYTWSATRQTMRRTLRSPTPAQRLAQEGRLIRNS